MKPACVAAVLFLILNIPRAVSAEGISGFAEYNYSLLDSKTNDATGTTKAKSSTFNQRYSLTMDKDIFPTLRFFAGGNFEMNDSDSSANGLNNTGSSTRINPTADLSYSNGVFSGGVGFSRRQESSKSNGVSSPTLFFDSYNTRFGWKPEELPSVDILYSVFNSYDEHHSSQDSTTTSTILSSRYRPLDSLDLSYQANYSTLSNKVAGFESQGINQSMRASYSDMFLGDRVSVSSSYNIATQDTRAQNNGAGPITLPPTQRTIDQLYFAATATTADASVTPSFAGSSNPNATSSVKDKVILDSGLAAIRDNVGIRSNLFPTNIIRILVSVGASNHVLTPKDYSDVTNAFLLNDPVNSKIKVYQSPAPDGTNWTPVPATITFSSLFNPNNTANSGISDGFEIRLSQTVPAGAFIKVEIDTVKAESIGNVFVQKISLTAIEAYSQDTTPLKPGQSKTSSQLSGLYDMNIKARLLNVPTIFYDVSFNLNHTKSDTQAFSYGYTLVNGLSLNHRFSPTLSTSARVAREDSVDPAGASRSADSASISLSAQPLPTLTQTINYGFRRDTDAGVTKRQHSLNLSNSAELYRGISLSLTGGGSMVSDSTGADQKSVTVTSGLNILPHKTLSINLSASDSLAWSSSADKPETTSSTQTGDLSVTYNPLPGIYLFGSYTINAQRDRKTQTAQSVGGSWSPFRDGTLLLNTSYRQNIDNNGNKDNTIVQSLRWNIRSGWFLDLSYLITTSTTASQTTDSQAFSTSLRMSF